MIRPKPHRQVGLFHLPILNCAMTSESDHLNPFLFEQIDEKQDMALIYEENELSYEVDQSNLSVGYQERVIRKSKTVPNKVPVLVI